MRASRGCYWTERDIIQRSGAIEWHFVQLLGAFYQNYTAYFALSRSSLILYNIHSRHMYYYELHKLLQVFLLHPVRCIRSRNVLLNKLLPGPNIYYRPFSVWRPQKIHVPRIEAGVRREKMRARKPSGFGGRRKNNLVTGNLWHSATVTREIRENFSLLYCSLTGENTPTEGSRSP